MENPREVPIVSEIRLKDKINSHPSNAVVSPWASKSLTTGSTGKIGTEDLLHAGQILRLRVKRNFAPGLHVIKTATAQTFDSCSQNVVCGVKAQRGGGSDFPRNSKNATIPTNPLNAQIFFPTISDPNVQKNRKPPEITAQSAQN